MGKPAEKVNPAFELEPPRVALKPQPGRSVADDEHGDIVGAAMPKQGKSPHSNVDSAVPDEDSRKDEKVLIAKRFRQERCLLWRILQPLDLRRIAHECPAVPRQPDAFQSRSRLVR